MKNMATADVVLVRAGEARRVGGSSEVASVRVHPHSLLQRTSRWGANLGPSPAGLCGEMPLACSGLDDSPRLKGRPLDA